MTDTLANDFTGLRTVVSGGASGIGRATALALKGRGAEVVSLDLDADTAPIDGIYCDVTRDSTVTIPMREAIKQLGGLDVLINCAGVGGCELVSEPASEEWRESFEVNVLGMARLTRAALPALRESASAAIVNICSVVGSFGYPDRVCYSATKGAVLALTRAMAADHFRDGIRVNCVTPCPAGVPVVPLQGISDDARSDVRAEWSSSVTDGEVANVICYLASPHASGTTGVDLTVDGGFDGLRVSA